MKAGSSIPLSSHPTTLSQATFKGWMDIMYAAVDSREVSGGGQAVAGEGAKGRTQTDGGTFCPSLPSPHATSSGAPESLGVERSIFEPQVPPVLSGTGYTEQPACVPKPTQHSPSYPVAPVEGGAATI